MAQTAASRVARVRPAAPYAVLVIDGNEEHQILSVTALGRKGFRVTSAESGKEGTKLALDQTFDAIVLGHKLKDATGIEVLKILTERRPDVPKIFVVPPEGEEAALRAMESGAQFYIVKTPRYNELLPAMVEELIQDAANRRRLAETQEAQARVVTERRSAEEKLSQSQARLRMILAQAPVLLWSTDTQLRVTSATGAGFHLLEVDPNVPRGRTLYEYFNARDDDVEPIASHRRALEGESVTTEIEWAGRTFDAHVEPLRSPDGAILGTIGVAFDVTERKRSEESLRRSDQRFVVLGHATHDVVWDWDLDTDGMWVNENLLTVFGYAAEDFEPTGTWWKRQIHPDDRQRISAGIATLISTGETAWSAEYRFRRKDGSYASVVDRGYVLHDNAGRPIRMIGSAMDVTRARRGDAIQSAVYRISEAANATQDLPGLYQAVHKIIGGLMPATNFYIALYDARTETLSFPYFVDEEEGPPPPQKLGRGLTEYVLRTGHPLLVSQASFQQMVHKGDVISVGPPSVDWVGAPLVSNGKTIGVIVVQSYKEGVRFGEEDKAILNFVSEQVAMAIDRKLAQESVHEKTSELEAIFRAVPDLYFRLGPDGTVLGYYAGRFADLYVPPDSFLGRKILEVLPKEVAAPFGKAMRRVLETGSLGTMEYALDVPSGKKQFEARILPLLNEQVVVVVRDITDKRAAEEALQTSVERYRPLFEANPNPMWVFDPTSLRFLAVNEAAVRQYGYTRDEFLAMTIKDIRPAHDVAALRREVAKPRDGLSSVGVWRHRKKDGIVIDVEVTTYPLEFDGRPSQLVLAQDITERRRAEAALRESNEALTALFEASPLAIIATDRDGKVRSWNPAAERIFGWKAAEVVGRPIPILPPGKDAETKETRETVLRGGSVSGLETQRVRKDGSLVDVRVSSGPMRDAQGDIRGTMAVFQDITSRKAMERRLADTERLATMGQLAGFIAHELNTPLTSISLLTTSIARRVKDDAVREKIEKINVERRRATGIIRELLNLTKDGQLAALPTDLRPIIKSAVEGVRPHLRKGVALEVDVGETPARATVDPLQIQEVVASLAANALDATEHGSVRVRLEARPTAYAIVVSDTGSGMSTDVREYLFEPFFTTKARGEGIGLGLLLSKYVITAHGGSIEVASEPGQGSTFTVLLPRGDAV
ncbi:MAG TPA: PAS domain S-box protein [Thermoplasmata archaeon]|nr:PAS domain S-box protein [Thermoplasmata archaeon]